MTLSTRCHRGVFELDTDAGITAEAIIVFTRGQCHALALALHELLPEWELVGHAYYGSDLPDHVYVRAPDGRTLDIEGWDVDGRWGYNDTQPENREVVLNAFDESYLDPDLDAARQFAPLVLHAYAADLVLQ